MSRKRQRKELGEFEELYSSLDDSGDEDEDIMGTIWYATTALAVTSNKRCGVNRRNPVNRT